MNARIAKLIRKFSAATRIRTGDTKRAYNQTPRSLRQAVKEQMREELQ